MAGQGRACRASSASLNPLFGVASGIVLDQGLIQQLEAVVRGPDIEQSGFKVPPSIMILLFLNEHSLQTFVNW